MVRARLGLLVPECHTVGAPGAMVAGRGVGSQEPGRWPARSISMSNTNSQIGVAVQGAGTVATEHLRAYLKNPHCRVVAIGSRTREGAANKARQVGLDPGQIGIYDRVQDLLAHPGL